MPSRRNVSSSSRYSPMTTRDRPRRSSRRTTSSSIEQPQQSRHYELIVIQQPSQGAAFSTPSSRQVLSPALVVQLVVRDRFGNELTYDEELPFLITHCSLWNGDGTTPIDMVDHSSSSPPPPPRTLHGTLVSSPHQLQNLDSQNCVFFFFPDLSIRTEGQYKIAIVLLRLSSNITSTESGSATTLANALSETFTIVSEEQAISQPEITDLTRHLVAQGANLLLNYETVIVSDLPVSASSGSSSGSSNSLLRVGGPRHR